MVYLAPGSVRSPCTRRYHAMYLHWDGGSSPRRGNPFVRYLPTPARWARHACEEAAAPRVSQQRRCHRRDPAGEEAGIAPGLKQSPVCGAGAEADPGQDTQREQTSSQRDRPVTDPAGMPREELRGWRRGLGWLCCSASCPQPLVRAGNWVGVPKATRRLRNFPSAWTARDWHGGDRAVSHAPHQAAREAPGLLSSAVAAHHWQAPVPSPLVPG